MAAVSIIAIVLVSVYRMHAQTISMNYSAKFYTTAPLLAQNKIAKVETMSSEEQLDSSGDFGDEVPGYRWKISMEDVESELLGETAKDLLRVDVTISLNDDENSYSLRTYRFIREDK